MSTTTSRRKASQFLSAPLLLLLGMVLFITWASLSEMDQSVRSTGQVIAVARNQIIQAADGGVLTQILVAEGEHVVAGQAVARLETTRTEAGYQETNTKLMALNASLARANAESKEQELLFDPKHGILPKFQLSQLQLFLHRKQTLNDELILLNAGLILSEEELRISQQLLKSGDISPVEMMKAQRQLQESQGRIAHVKNKYLQEAKQDVIRLEEEISSQRFKLNERQSLLDHSVLNTPVAGIVKVLRVSTVGGVLRAGDEIMHISPTQSGQVVEAKINPSDRGEISLGMPVNLKFDAFDYSVYGMLNGTLSYISSDTLTEQGSAGTAQTYYRVQVKLLPGTKLLSPDDLKPGMTATLDIRTRARTVLHYLTKPVQKAFTGALHER
jgi:adhesin transport system membrane fusion protein